MSDEISLDLSPLIRILKDGTVERLLGTTTLPAGHDPETQVVSNIYAPSAALTSGKKNNLPLLVYYHGGGFCIESAFSPLYHGYLNALVAAAQIVAVSVEYRLVPEHPLPCAYEDSWAALKWAASHAGGHGAEEWSAGANIAHNVAMRNGGEEKLIDQLGVVLVDPYFWGKDPIGNEPKDEESRRVADGLWLLAYPGSVGGLDDPKINATINPKLPGLGCKRVLVMVAEKDMLKDRGWSYYEAMGKNGWKGTVEIEETKGEGHVFHLFNPASDSAAERLKRTVLFLNREGTL
ncbi:Probable carboxylesterase 13 [Linum grandiflorum]